MEKLKRFSDVCKVPAEYPVRLQTVPTGPGETAITDGSGVLIHRDPFRR